MNIFFRWGGVVAEITIVIELCCQFAFCCQL